VTRNPAGVMMNSLFNKGEHMALLRRLWLVQRNVTHAWEVFFRQDASLQER
jgi:hypothetical protein